MTHQTWPKAQPDHFSDRDITAESPLRGLKRGTSWTTDSKVVLSFLAVFMVLATLIVAFHADNGANRSTILLWATACLVSGALFGFLFGIPKIVQSGALYPFHSPEKSSANDIQQREQNYHQQVNTNLTEISDWLTKTIVGLSLIKLKDLPTALEDLARNLANGINDDDTAFSTALIVGFTVIGFLIGYLCTRLVLQSAFSQADQDAANVQRTLAAMSEEIESNKQILQQTRHRLKLELGSANARLTNLDTVQNFLKDSLYSEDISAPSKQFQAEEHGEDAMAYPRDLADRYVAIRIEDYSERVRMKDAYANHMVAYILRANISHDDITKMAASEKHQGLIIALASVINADPSPGDFERLSRVATLAQFKHVRYRVALAIGKLFSARMAGSAEQARALEILDSYMDGTDGSLKNQIQQTRSLVNTMSMTARGGTTPR